LPAGQIINARPSLDLSHFPSYFYQQILIQ
jgi:hypothetical protein